MFLYIYCCWLILTSTALFSLTQEAAEQIQQLRAKHKLPKSQASYSIQLRDLTEQLRKKTHRHPSKQGETFLKSDLSNQKSNAVYNETSASYSLAIENAPSSNSVLAEKEPASPAISSNSMKENRLTFSSRRENQSEPGLLDFFINVFLLIMSFAVGFVLIKRLGCSLIEESLSVSLKEAPIFTLLQIFYLLVGFFLVIWGITRFLYLWQNHLGLIVLLTLFLAAPKEFEKFLNFGANSLISLLVLAIILPIALGSNLIALILCSVAALSANKRHFKACQSPGPQQSFYSCIYRWSRHLADQWCTFYS